MNDRTVDSQGRLVQALDEVASHWDISGALFVLEHGRLVYDKTHGWADRERQQATRPSSRYVLDSEDRFFTSMAVLCLIDQGFLRLGDRLERYIPEYPPAKDISIRQLLKGRTGIPDFFYNRIMVDLDRDDAYKAQGDEARIRQEKRLYYQNRRFDRVMTLIEGMDLQYKPGTPDMDSSSSNAVFLAEVVRRITGQSVFEVVKQRLFTPIGMEGVRAGNEADTVSYAVFRETRLVRLPLDYTLDGLISVAIEDMQKLLAALAGRRLFSERLWQTILSLDSQGDGLLFTNANGFHCADAEFLGSSFSCYFNHDNGLAFASLVNEDQILRCTNGSWYYFRRDCREAITAAYCRPQNTKMVRINKNNWWDALNLKVAEGQEEFVMDAKSSVAMGLLYRTKQVYVQMEGSMAVGLLVLEVDKKNQRFHIDIILIDQRFQGRGYGKLMLRFAVDTLKTAGARELTIGVNRFNYAAQKIYMSAGFTPKSIYQEGMELHIRLDQ